MALFEKSKWIWADTPVFPDQYTEYIDTVCYDGGKATLRISCDTDYTLFCNGKYVASNQYGDFEHYKIYDTVDLTPYLRNGENSLKLTVYYCGVNTSRYKIGAAGLIYEVEHDGEIICHSGEKTLSRLSPTYASGVKRLVSSQLGFTFTYDATRESEDGYAPSVAVNKNVSFFPRPIKKLSVLPRHEVREIKKEPFGYLIDLGREVVGFCTLDIVSSCEQTITVAYGESLDDGRVRARIHNRNFLFEYKAKKGKNTFTNYMLRLGCRYLEVISDEPVEIGYVGILPEIYEVRDLPYDIKDTLDHRIYGICLNTLHLCMMEHYVDTPWREQCLYAFDARNQMLCGYYALEGGNRDYARSNLILFSEDRRQNALLSICSPAGNDKTIPSFSLYYVIAMKEYAAYTKDISLIKKYSSKMEGIIDEFLSHREGGLISKLPGAKNWNFYDWSPYLAGTLNKEEAPTPDLVINSLFVLALDSLEAMCNMAEIEFKYERIADELRVRIRRAFASDEALLSHSVGGAEFTALGNSLAILCGAVSHTDASAICEAIVRGDAIPSSLSMNIWKYEALMMTDETRYRDYILNEIRKNYGRMLDCGSTTVWETERGSADFGNAGSLCHGWSAIPIYIFYRLGIAE